MNSPDLIEALQALAVDKGISIDTLFGALADAFESAYKRLPDSQEYAWVIIDPDTGEVRVMAQALDDDGIPEGEEFDVTPPPEVLSCVIDARPSDLLGTLRVTLHGITPNRPRPRIDIPVHITIEDQLGHTTDSLDVRVGLVVRDLRRAPRR
jgi:hypothetical protein